MNPLARPRPSDVNIHQSPGALLPVRALLRELEAMQKKPPQGSICEAVLASALRKASCYEGGLVATTKSNGKRPKPGARWVASVKTDSTHPPEGLFTKDASTIARTLASKKVSPKGPASGLRMLTYFINRAGKQLSSSRRAELKRAETLLSKRVHAKSKG